MPIHGLQPCYGPWYGLWPYWLMAHMPIPRSYGPCLWHDGLWPTIGHTTCGPLHGLTYGQPIAHVAYSHMMCLYMAYSHVMAHILGTPMAICPTGISLLALAYMPTGPSVQLTWPYRPLHRPLDYTHYGSLDLRSMAYVLCLRALRHCVARPLGLWPRYAYWPNGHVAYTAVNTAFRLCHTACATYV